MDEIGLFINFLILGLVEIVLTYQGTQFFEYKLSLGGKVIIENNVALAWKLNQESSQLCALFRLDSKLLKSLSQILDAYLWSDFIIIICKEKNCHRLETLTNQLLLLQCQFQQKRDMIKLLCFNIFKALGIYVRQRICLISDNCVLWTLSQFALRL